MSNYYLLEKKIITCSSKLKDKYIKDGYQLVATSTGWNNVMKIKSNSSTIKNNEDDIQ